MENSYLFVDDNDAGHKRQVEQEASSHTDNKVAHRTYNHTLFHIKAASPQF